MSAPGNNKDISAGDWVALVLTPDAAPLRCYVGEVQAVGDRGVRITLIDWISGRASGFDFFAPWSSITSSLVATKQHDLADFGKVAAKWQQDVDHRRDAETGGAS